MVLSTLAPITYLSVTAQFRLKRPYQGTAKNELTLGGVPRPLSPATSEADEGVLVEGVVLAARVRRRVADGRPSVRLRMMESPQNRGRNGDENEADQHRGQRKFLSFGMNFPSIGATESEGKYFCRRLRCRARSTWAFAKNVCTTQLFGIPYFR